LQGEQILLCLNFDSINVLSLLITMLSKLSVEKGCVYADVWSAEGQRDWLVYQDTVHANKAGNMLIAHKVFESIVLAVPGITNKLEKKVMILIQNKFLLIMDSLPDISLLI
jgi:hypothetical protein